MKLVPTAISTKIARQVLQGRKSAPNLLFYAGIAGMGCSTGLACRATLQMQTVLEKARADLEKHHDAYLEANARAIKHLKNSPTHDYSEQDYRKDVAVIYTRSAAATLRLYAPALIVGVASVVCLSKSHEILVKRNAALAAAYVAVDEAFTSYRKRVVDKYGEEQDREFRYPTEEVEVIDESGKILVEKRIGEGADGSMYARFFDQFSSANWTNNYDYNFTFLRCQQQWANNQLATRGHVFLNEVYDALGLYRTTPGSVVGWVVSDDGDNFIDFGIFADRQGVGVKDFTNGRDGAILLDFNVDGVIYDQINEGKRS